MLQMISHLADLKLNNAEFFEQRRGKENTSLDMEASHNNSVHPAKWQAW